MSFLLFIFLQINLCNFYPSDTIWKKTLKYIAEGKMKVFEGRNFFIFDESNYTSLDINDDKMEILYQKQKELYINYGIPNYIFVVDNHNENSESLTEATHNLAAYLNKEFSIDKNKAIIGYLSIQSRRIKIRTGEIIRKNITDLDAQNMINNLRTYLQKEAYYEAWIKFIDDINYYRDDNSKVINRVRSSSKKSNQTFLIIIIIIGSIFIIALIIFICIKCSYKFRENYIFNAPYSTNAVYTENKANCINNMSITDILTFLKNNKNNQNIFIDYCVICLKQFKNTDPRNISTYICGHIFHYNCLSKLKVLGCPICRQRLNPRFNQENSKIIWGIQQENKDELKKYDYNKIFPFYNNENKNIIENTDAFSIEKKKDVISIEKNKDYGCSNFEYNIYNRVNISNTLSHNFSNKVNEKSYHSNSYGIRDDDSGGGDDGDSGGGDDGDCGGGDDDGSGGADGDW